MNPYRTLLETGTCPPAARDNLPPNSLGLMVRVYVNVVGGRKWYLSQHGMVQAPSLAGIYPRQLILPFLREQQEKGLQSETWGYEIPTTQKKYPKTLSF